MTVPNIIDPLKEVAAARRLTRLITKDEISRPLREHRFVSENDKLSYLLNCDICVSVYTSAAIVLMKRLFPRFSKPVIHALALAEAQATLTEIESQRAALEQDYGPPL